MVVLGTEQTYPPSLYDSRTCENHAERRTIVLGLTPPSHHWTPPNGREEQDKKERKRLKLKQVKMALKVQRIWRAFRGRKRYKAKLTINREVMIE
jgi:hypothetical protein